MLSPDCLEFLREEEIDGGDDALKQLVDYLAEAESFELLARPVQDAVGSLVNELRGVHVLSFTNHQTMVVNDLVSGALDVVASDTANLFPHS